MCAHYGVGLIPEENFIGMTPIIGTIQAPLIICSGSLKPSCRLHLPALDCILTSTNTPQNYMHTGLQWKIYAVRSYGDNQSET